MQKLNNYILEKLKLNKHIQIGKKFISSIEICNILKTETFTKGINFCINHWMQEKNINSFNVYYYFRGDFKESEYKYDLSHFTYNAKKVEEFIDYCTLHSGANEYLYKEKDFSILHNNVSKFKLEKNNIENNILIIDKRLEKGKYIYFLLEPCKN